MIKIVQRRLFKPTQNIKLTDDDFIEITIKRVLSERSFKLDLHEFAAEPSHQKSIPHNPVALAILFGLLTLTGLIPALTVDDATQREMSIFSAICWSSLAAASLLYAWFTRSDFIAYFSRSSGNAILTLYNGYPEAKSFEEFVKALNTRLKALNSRYAPSKESNQLERDYPFSLN